MRHSRYMNVFMEATDARAIYIAAIGASGPVKVGATKDIAKRTSDGNRATGPTPIIQYVRWCQPASVARAIVGLCKEELASLDLLMPGPWLGISVEDAAWLLDRIAASLGVELETKEQLEARATSIVGRVEREFAALQASDALRDLNRSYGEYRLQRAEEGQGTLSYAAWIASYKVGLVAAAAQQAVKYGERVRRRRQGALPHDEGCERAA